MREKLSALYALQQVDSRLDQLKKQYSALDPGRKEEAEARQAREAHEAISSTLTNSSAALHDAELEQKTVEAKRDEVQKKLYGGTVRVAKELQAMQEEVEMLGRQRSRLDEQILTLMDAIETERNLELEASAARASAEEKLAACQAAYKQAADQLATEARATSAERKQAAAAASPDLMKRYETLRAAKAGLAIVAIEDGNRCGGCKMSLPSAVLARAAEYRTIELCQNCGRILFDTREPKSE